MRSCQVSCACRCYADCLNTMEAPDAAKIRRVIAQVRTAVGNSLSAHISAFDSFMPVLHMFCLSSLWSGLLVQVDRGRKRIRSCTANGASSFRKHIVQEDSSLALRWLRQAAPP